MSSPRRIESGNSSELPYVTEMFGELYFRESKNSVFPSDAFFPPLPPLRSEPKPDPSAQTKVQASNSGNHQKETKDDAADPTAGSAVDGNKAVQSNHEKKKGKYPEDTCRYPDSSGKMGEMLFPPPISCLNLFTGGKPFVYHQMDKNTGKFVTKTVNLPPPGGMMRVQRKDGRIKMSIANDTKEQEEPEEEQEEEQDQKKKKKVVEAEAGEEKSG